MRVESSVTSVSWIPSEAIPGTMKLPFEIGVAHYDPPPPEVIDDLEPLRAADRFRFANVLRGWIEVEGGEIVDYGQAGGGLLSSTTVRFGGRGITFAAAPFPELRPEPVVGDGAVRFRQTVGARTGAPFPRRVSHPPYVQVAAPTVWTTLELAIHADGTSGFEVVGASPFPRHWFYDAEGKLAAKSGLTDFKAWSLDCFGDHSPWGGMDSPALVAAVETALERQMSAAIMRAGEKPRIQKLPAGQALVEEGAEGVELYLLLDGMFEVEIAGNVVAEVGPGAIVGERAILEEGRRTATVRAVTPARVAVATPDQFDRDVLAELAKGRRTR